MTTHKIHSIKTLYQGFFKTLCYTFQYKRYDQQWSNIVHHEVFIRSDAVAILPFDPIKKQVILVEQFRTGAILHDNPHLIETIAGMINDDETPLQAAHRELFEESGLTSQQWSKIGLFYTSPGACTERLHIFCAYVDAEQALEYAGLQTENESIKVLKYDLKRIAQGLEQNSFTVAPTVVALQWLLMNHPPAAQTPKSS